MQEYRCCITSTKVQILTQTAHFFVDEFGRQEPLNILHVSLLVLLYLYKSTNTDAEGAAARQLVGSAAQVQGDTAIEALERGGLR